MRIRSRIINTIMASLVATTAMMGVNASPAAAASGGEINNLMGGNSVAITNCWNPNNGSKYIGEYPRCGEGSGYIAPYALDSKSAYRFLPPHTNSRALPQPNWFDVDAFRVSPGCAMYFRSWTGEVIQYNAKQSYYAWYKIDNWTTYNIVNMDCS